MAQQDPGLPTLDQSRVNMPIAPEVKLPALPTWEALRQPAAEQKPINGHDNGMPVFQPKPEAPEQEEPSPSGFFRNLGNNMIDVVKGLGQMAWYVPDKLIRGGSEWVQYLRGQRDAIGNDFSGDAMDVIKQGMHENFKQVIKSTAESIAEYKHPLEKAYNRPLDILLDALTVADLGSTAAGSYASRAAEAASRLGNASEAARWTEIASRAEKGAIWAFLRPMSESPTVALARKIPWVDQALTSLKLTPEAIATNKLLNELKAYREVAYGDDLRGFNKVFAGVAPEELDSVLNRVANGKLAPEALSPAGQRANEVLRGWVEEMERTKIELGGLTEQQARNAALVPVRVDMARTALGKLRNAGGLDDRALLALNYILDGKRTATQARQIMAKLADRGYLDAILTDSGEVTEALESKDPRKWLLKRFANQSQPTLNVSGTALRQRVLQQIKGAISVGEDAKRNIAALEKIQFARESLRTKYVNKAAAAFKASDETYSRFLANIKTGFMNPAANPIAYDAWRSWWETHGGGVYDVLDNAGNHIGSRATVPSMFDLVYTHGHEAPFVEATSADTAIRLRASHGEMKYNFELGQKLSAEADIIRDRIDASYRNMRVLHSQVVRGEFAKADWLQNWKALSEKQVFESVEQHLATTGKDPYYNFMLYKSHLDAATPFLKGELRGLKQAWMKARTGAGGNVTDVRLLYPIMAKQFRDFEQAAQFFRRFKELPFVKDITDSLKDGSYVQPKGTQIFSHEGTYQAFYKDVMEQEKRLGTALQKLAGRDGQAMPEHWREAITKSVTPDINADLLKRLNERQKLRVYEIPKEVGDMVTKQFGQVHPLAKMVFDAPADLLRATALYMNPFWYAHTTIGHAIQNLLSGMNPFSYQRGGKNFAKIIPEELKTAVEAGLNTGMAQGMKQGWLNNLPPFRQLGDFQRGVEHWFRTSNFMDNLTKEAVKRKLLTTGEAMFAANDVIAKKIAPLFEDAAIRGPKTGAVLGIDQASAVQEAINRTNSWLGNYNNMHPIERDIIRRIIPFWSFVKNMNLLALRLPIDRPLLSRALGQIGELHREQVAHAMINSMDDEALPDWLEGHVPLGYDSTGNMVFVSIKGLNPFNNFGHIFDPKKLVTHTNPIVKATLEYFGGRDIWSKKDLKSNEPIFDYSGNAWKVRLQDGKTTLVRDVPGEGFAAQFFGQYPQIKLFRALLSGLKSDEKGNPVATPFMDEHGNWQYPTSILDTALRMFGANIKRVDPEQMRVSNIKERVAFVRNMERTLKSAPPEYRDFVLESIRRAGAGLLDKEE